MWSHETMRFHILNGQAGGALGRWLMTKEQPVPARFVMPVSFITK
jgi:hypothetical protein